jgi:hypothetical protein
MFKREKIIMPVSTLFDPLRAFITLPVFKISNLGPTLPHPDFQCQ